MKSYRSGTGINYIASFLPRTADSIRATVVEILLSSGPAVPVPCRLEHPRKPVLGSFRLSRLTEKTCQVFFLNEAFFVFASSSAFVIFSFSLPQLTCKISFPSTVAPMTALPSFPTISQPSGPRRGHLLEQEDPLGSSLLFTLGFLQFRQ